MLLCDINCDMGERVGYDETIMPFISSANIACGYHAGDAEMMLQTLLLAKKYGVAAGAHPSFSDRKNFGRIVIDLPVNEIYELVQQQLSILNEIAKKHEIILHHVKPHGALYTMAAKDPAIAKAIAFAVKEFDEKLVLFGLSGSHSITEAQKIGLKTKSEVFADRTYQDDGSLTPRSQANALINDVSIAVQQVQQMVQSNTVTTATGKIIPIVAETICIHGDGEHAVVFAKAIHKVLKL